MFSFDANVISLRVFCWLDFPGFISFVCFINQVAYEYWFTAEQLSDYGK